MADDQNQRPYRSNDAAQRAAAGSASNASSNDPLAELARLIGQNDPFSEFGGNGAKRATPVARQPEPTPDWRAEPVRSAPQATPYTGPDFSRQSYGSAPLQGGNDAYEAEGQHAHDQQAPAFGGPDYEVGAYGAPGYETSGFPTQPEQGYEQDPFPPAAAQHGPADDDYYDDVPPNRRRFGILAIAGIFALAVIGTAGAFGYRAVFGSSAISGPPPVIKAEQTPSKIVAAATPKDAPAKNNERVNGSGERLVSREEQPVVVTTQTPPPPAAGSPNGNGVVGSEPKRIRTIAIKPEGGDASAMPTPPNSIPAPTAQPRAVPTTPQRPAAPPQQAQTPAPTQAAPAPAPRSAPAPTARAEAPANAPLSLDAASRPAAPQRAAAVAPPPAPASSNAASGVYGVQVTAQRSEEEAQTAFRSLQGKFPGQLGNRQPMIKRVDAGDKGIFYGAQVGPFTDSAQAKQMCETFKAAGGSCLVKKN